MSDDLTTYLGSAASVVRWRLGLGMSLLSRLLRGRIPHPPNHKVQQLCQAKAALSGTKGNPKATNGKPKGVNNELKGAKEEQKADEGKHKLAQLGKLTALAARGSSRYYKFF